MLSFPVMHKVRRILYPVNISINLTNLCYFLIYYIISYASFGDSLLYLLLPHIQNNVHLIYTHVIILF